MNIKLLVEYWGDGFSGWQAQPGQRTVQGEIEEALSVYFNSVSKRERGEGFEKRVVLQASGRTDAGVHARGQVASFLWPEELSCDLEAFLTALNGITPDEIFLRSAEEVSDDFHPRHSPHSKCYSYRLVFGRTCGGLYRSRAWYVAPKSLNIVQMIEAARLLTGQHDFSSFQASDCTAKSTERTLLVSELTRCDTDTLLYVTQGTGFLKNMIRIIMGTLLEVGQGKRDTGDMLQLLETKDRTQAGRTAPPDGLTLEWVRYLESPYWQEG